MARPVTLFTGQWADLPLETLAEKAARFRLRRAGTRLLGRSFRGRQGAVSDDGYVQSRWDILNKHGLKCFAISNHLVGQCVSDAIIDERHKSILPAAPVGRWRPRRRAPARRRRNGKNTARAAKNVRRQGRQRLHRQPDLAPDLPLPADHRRNGRRGLPRLRRPLESDPRRVRRGQASVSRWKRIPPRSPTTSTRREKTLDGAEPPPGVRLQLRPQPLHPPAVQPGRVHHEPSPTGSITSTSRTRRSSSNGRSSILGSHLNFGDPRRGWDFVSPGRGDVDLRERSSASSTASATGTALGRVGRQRHGSGTRRARSRRFVRRIDFAPSAVAFDAAFASKE